MRATAEERFNMKFVQRGPDECWLWHAATRHGYGCFSIGPKSVQAHVFAWELANNRGTSAGMDIMHTCHNRLCVNPAHLQEGTRSENMQQMLAASRHASQNGTPYAGGRPISLFCKHGHQYTIENTYINPSGSQVCRICMRTRKKQN